MSTIREYGWQDWIRDPKNEQLYRTDQVAGLRQFKLEQERRNRLAQHAAFKFGGKL